MNKMIHLCAALLLASCGSTTASSAADDTTTANDTATTDASTTGDGATAGDTVAADTTTNTCTAGISLSGGPAFMTPCFAHNDGVNPKPVELKSGGNVSVEFTQRAASAPDTLILTVVWDEADATAFKRVLLTTGHADYTSFDTTNTCGLGCTSASQGVAIDTVKRTITFTKTVISHYNPYGASYDTPVTLNGTLSY